MSKEKDNAELSEENKKFKKLIESLDFDSVKTIDELAEKLTYFPDRDPKDNPFETKEGILKQFKDGQNNGHDHCQVLFMNRTAMFTESIVRLESMFFDKKGNRISREEAKIAREKAKE